MELSCNNAEGRRTSGTWQSFRDWLLSSLGFMVVCYWEEDADKTLQEFTYRKIREDSASVKHFRSAHVRTYKVNV
jgi:hypothetical protein